MRFRVLNEINKNGLDSSLCFSKTLCLASKSPIAQSTTLENHLLQDKNKSLRLFYFQKRTTGIFKMCSEWPVGLYWNGKVTPLVYVKTSAISLNFRCFVKTRSSLSLASAVMPRVLSHGYGCIWLYIQGLKSPKGFRKRKKKEKRRKGKETLKERDWTKPRGGRAESYCPCGTPLSLRLHKGPGASRPKRAALSVTQAQPQVPFPSAAAPSHWPA